MKRRRQKKLILFFLTFILMLSILPITAFAVNGTQLSSDGGELAAGEYYLNDNTTLINNLIIPANTKVTLDLNNFSLTGNGNGSVITVEGTLILNDTSSSGGGTITGGNSEYGGGIYVGEYGKVEMNGGKVSENTASHSGGGVYLEMRNASFTLNKGEISHNTADVGAGVRIGQYTTFTMEGGSISRNTASIRGGGMYVDISSTLSMSGGEISNNVAASSEGGGVYMSNADFTMSGTARVNSNTAKSHGGGIYVPGSADFSMNGGEISENKSTAGLGGGIYISLNSNTDAVVLNGAKITRNQAEDGGGGIHIFLGCIKMSGEIIISDNSKTDGSVDNLYARGLADKCVFTGELTGNSNIGYKTSEFHQPASNSAVQISATEDSTTYYQTAKQYFTSDEGHGIRANDDGYLELYYIHRHNWSAAWSINDTHHWHECSSADCPITENSQKNSYTAHTYDQQMVSEAYKVHNATCTEPATYYKSCVCGKAGTETFTTGDAAGHSCSGSYQSNADGHWQECAVCNEKSDMEAHTYSGWTVTKAATASTAGSRERTCTVCGYRVSEIIAAAGTNNTNSPKTGDSSSLTLWIALLLLACGGLTAIRSASVRGR